MFVHSYVASKIETKKKNERESNDEIKIIDWCRSSNDVEVC